jgi:hypothetical protein
MTMENSPTNMRVFARRVGCVVNSPVVSANKFPVAEHALMSCMTLDRNQGLRAGDQEVRQLFGTCRMCIVDDGEHITPGAALNKTSFA